MDIFNLTALELSNLIHKGELNAVEVTLRTIERVEELNREFNFLITLDKEYAIAQAKKVDDDLKSGKLTSLLAGVPIVVKDNICTKGIKTTAASKMLSDFVPCYDANVVKKLKEAGIIVIGKANMDEFAMGSTGETSFFGAVKNPRNKNKAAGGSSSGCAAAVASSAVFAAIGSDTGGSVRQPASHCGVVGFKPTYGRVSRYGLIAYASSLDQIGPICKDIDDTAAFMKILSGSDCLDGTSLNEMFDYSSANNEPDFTKIKIAVPSLAYSEYVDGSVLETLEKTQNHLQTLGATVEKVDCDILRYAVAAYYIIATAEASSNLSRYDGVKYGYRTEDADSLSEIYKKSRSEGFGFETKKRILLGTFALSSGYYDAYYNKALKVKKLISEKLQEIFSRYDAILLPTSPITAPLIGESLNDPIKMYLSDIFTVTANLAGLPAISIPMGCDEEQMPIGIQLMADKLEDEKLLSVGKALYHLRGGAER